jgi:sigma54 specific transcriptional regulator, fis family
VRLLRVLENGEFIKVGSSVVQKTNVRIVAATNVQMQEAIKKGRFREDLYYRLSTVEIHLPPLRERKEDIHLLFRKFASDFAEKYKMPPVKLSEDAVHLLTNYRWSGNIRQLRNVAEQISVLEQRRDITASILRTYLPDEGSNLPQVVPQQARQDSDFSNERELLYKVLFDMKSDLNDLKKLTLELLQHGNSAQVQQDNEGLIHRIYGNDSHKNEANSPAYSIIPVPPTEKEILSHEEVYDYEEAAEEERFSLQEQEREMIRKSLEHNGGKRKETAKALGISERTLYRKLKQYNMI